MIFTILNDVFEDNSASTIKVLDTIWLSIGERHTFYINNIDDIESLHNSEWFKYLRPVYREEVEMYITRSVQSSYPSAALIVSNQSKDYYTVTEAREILTKPVTLVLENVENDAHFVRALLKNFKKKGKKIEQHLNNGWLKFGMGAGSTIPNLIRSEKRRFDENKDSFPKNSHSYLRYFALIDSDKLHPDQPLKDEKQNLVQFLEENEIPFHILAKREMENYLPDAVFEEISHNEDYIRCYLSLSDVQKDFFDIGSGFPNKPFEQLLPEIKDLYGGISATSKDIFRNRELEIKDKNGKKLSVKTELPKLFLSQNVTQEGLQNRAGSDELQKILDKISELL